MKKTIIAALAATALTGCFEETQEVKKTSSSAEHFANTKIATEAESKRVFGTIEAKLMKFESVEEFSLTAQVADLEIADHPNADEVVINFDKSILEAGSEGQFDLTAAHLCSTLFNQEATLKIDGTEVADQDTKKELMTQLQQAFLPCSANADNAESLFTESDVKFYDEFHHPVSHWMHNSKVEILLFDDVDAVAATEAVKDAEGKITQAAVDAKPEIKGQTYYQKEIGNKMRFEIAKTHADKALITAQENVDKIEGYADAQNDVAKQVILNGNPIQAAKLELSKQRVHMLELRLEVIKLNDEISAAKEGQHSPESINELTANLAKAEQTVKAFEAVIDARTKLEAAVTADEAVTVEAKKEDSSKAVKKSLKALTQAIATAEKEAEKELETEAKTEA